MRPGPGPGASSGAGQQALLVADLKLLLIEQVAEAGEEERLVVVFGAQQIGELSAEVGGGGLEARGARCLGVRPRLRCCARPDRRYAPREWRYFLLWMRRELYRA